MDSTTSPFRRLESRVRDLEGRVMVVTGVSSGIGRVTAEALAARGAQLLLGGRSRPRAEPVLAAIARAGGSAEFFEVELSDLDSVRAFGERLRERPEPLHGLVNNAGLAGRKEVTRQGFELSFGVNHLAHFLLTQLLLPKLLENPASRIVNVASVAHHKVRALDFDALRRSGRNFGAFHEYAVSKLCNILHAKELDRRYRARGLLACSVHPGVVRTDVWREVPQPLRSLIQLGMISSERGARTTIHAVASPEVEGGRYYDDCRPREPSRLARDEALAAELWERSLAWTK